MSRELERRVAALERATSSNRTQFIVSDSLPEDGNDDRGRVAPMTEAEWLQIYGKVEAGPLQGADHSGLGTRERRDLRVPLGNGQNFVAHYPIVQKGQHRSRCMRRT